MRENPSETSRRTGDEAFTHYHSLKVWECGLRAHWGKTLEDFPDRLDIVRQFCRFVERSPDDIVSDCERVVDGGKRIRTKSRRFYNEKIDEFQERLRGSRLDRARRANIIRSFLIHNGIFVQGGSSG